MKQNKKYFFGAPIQKYSAELLQKFEIFKNPNVYLHRLEWDSELAVAVSREQVKNNESLSKLQIYCFENPNHIYEYPMKILTSKKFGYLNELNRFIQMSSESGLIDKWLKGSEFKNLGKEIYQSQYIKVDFDVFIVLVVFISLMLLFSFYVFYVERSIDKRNITKSDSPFWRIIKIIIDADRHFFMYDLYHYDKDKHSKSKK